MKIIVFYYGGKTYLLALVRGIDRSEGRLSYFGNELPEDQNDIDNMLTELAEVFRINGLNGQGWDNNNPRTQFVPKILVKKEGPWV